MTSGVCVLGEGLGLWLRNETSIGDSFTISTCDFEPLGGASGCTYASFCFYIDSRDVLE